MPMGERMKVHLRDAVRDARMLSLQQGRRGVPPKTDVNPRLGSWGSGAAEEG
jgi:hypothetical protein